MSELQFFLEDGPSLIVRIENKEFGPKRILYRDTLKSLAKKDAALIDFLIKEELRHLGISSLSSQADTASFSRIRISLDKIDEAMKLLGSSNLFYKKEKLFVDPFTPCELFLQASYQEEKLLVEGKFLFAGKQKDAAFQGFFYGASCWVLLSGTLYKLFKKVEKNWFSLINPSLLEGKQKERFLEQFEEEPPLNAPKVGWKNAPAPKKIIEPFPFIMLSDRSGAFANLWMDYQHLGKVSFHDAKKIPFRDLAKEKFWEKDLLETGFIVKVRDNSHYFCPLDQVAKSLTFLLEMGWPLFDYQGKRIVRQKEMVLSLHADKEKIFIKGNISFEDHKANVEDVVGAFTRREQFIQLSENTVGLFDKEMLNQELGDMDALEVGSSGLSVKKSSFGLLDPLLQNPKIKKDKDILVLKDLTIKQSLPSETFKGTLHPYQQEGVNWLSFLHEAGFSGLLADEMGLGKTVQALAFFSRLKKGPILVVVPTSLVFNWQRESEKFLAKTSIYIHQGKDRAKSIEELSQYQIIITSYAILRIDAAFLQSIPFSCIVLDEAQYIKNPESQVARACFSLQGDFRLAITGTPMENRWDDLWSLFHFLLPELLGEQKEFKAKMLTAQADSRYLHQLKRKLRPFLLRRKKEEVAQDLPEKIEQIVWTQMQEPQRSLYEEWVAKNRMGLLNKVEKEGIASCRMEILEAILRLRQICCHPFLVDSSVSLESEMSGKLERLLVDIEEALQEKRKILIYSQFTKMLHIIEKELQKRNWSYSYLDGSTKDREEAVRKFQEEETPLFLVSLKAGGVGLNLTAADYVFLFDPWWNEAVEAQAIDRAHRFGRKGTVIARRYVTPLSIEEKIMRLKEHKSALSQVLLDMDEMSMNLTFEDIYELLL